MRLKYFCGCVTIKVWYKDAESKAHVRLKHGKSTVKYGKSTVLYRNFFGAYYNVAEHEKKANLTFLR